MDDLDDLLVRNGLRLLDEDLAGPGQAVLGEASSVNSSCSDSSPEYSESRSQHCVPTYGSSALSKTAKDATDNDPSYGGEFRIETEAAYSTTERERGFLRAIFGSHNLHKLWFPIEPDGLPVTEDALSNYLIENLIPTELNRFFVPAAWCKLKALVERKRRAWTCRLCSIPRNRNMMQCEECHSWFHMCCVQAVRSSTYVSSDAWICVYCVEKMKKCTVLLNRMNS